MTDREERIRQLAHRIWESEGRPAGQAQRHWRMAEKLVDIEPAAPSRTPPAPPRPDAAAPPPKPRRTRKS
ncbi:DUF2934 domain-containing protein [Frateuria defendens]|uniref:DUF2934 domain-containing protein n=1 Tax=Frateuria defendens TaxID=2219559 RepID=UPI0009E61E08|nr:DUF2934 domain-containing protein [Frateuria defendens]